MKATTTNGKEIKGANLSEIAKKLGAELSIDGLRALTAKSETGSVIHVSLYDNESYIRSKNGKLLSSW